MTITFDTTYLTELNANLRYVHTNRRALSDAAHAGDLLAGVIISRVRDIAAGDYKPSAIKAFNLECEAYRAQEVAHV